jgi:aspartate/methionine/tyrosine aminotransferase
MAALTGARSVYVPTAAGDGFAIDVERVKRAITSRTKAILVASPANPTGAVQSRATIEALSSLGLPVLSDEIYDGLVFDGAKVTSPLGIADECFVFDGFSKRHAMTGFRLGYVIAPPSATRRLQSLQQNLFISAADFVQHAGVAALRHGAPHLASLRDALARRREKLVAGVRSLGFGLDVAPTGAFYVLASDAKN